MSKTCMCMDCGKVIKVTEQSNHLKECPKKLAPIAAQDVDKVEADQIAGDILKEIEKSLGVKSFDDLRRLLVIFGCQLGELTHKIARAKGIKNVEPTRNKKRDRVKTRSQGDFEKRKK